jgi:hypothetical protein
MGLRDAAAPGRETEGRALTEACGPLPSMTDSLSVRPTPISVLLRADLTAPTVTPDAKPERSRCVRCGHPLALPRSVARAYGAKCWRRTAVAQLDARRDTLGRVLGRVARRVAVLDAAGLAIVTTALGDVLASLDAAAVTL